MIKKLLLAFSFITLLTIAFGETTYKAQAAEDTTTVSEEISKLNELYKEGIITEEEFSKAKAILLSPDKKSKKIKKVKIKLTAAERERLEELKKEEELALKEQIKAERRAERERTLEEKRQIAEERQRVCAENPNSKECKKLKKRLSTIFEKIKLIHLEQRQREQVERDRKKQTILETKKRKTAEKQAALQEQEQIKAEQEARKSERKRLKAEWKKACLEDPEGKACKEGKPSEKIKSLLKKIEKKLKKN